MQQSKKTDKENLLLKYQIQGAPQFLQFEYLDYQALTQNSLQKYCTLSVQSRLHIQFQCHWKHNGSQGNQNLLAFQHQCLRIHKTMMPLLILHPC